jgi:hypothetical protein
MTDTDLHQTGPGPLRAAAEAAELAQVVSGLAGIDGCHLAYGDPLAPLARDVARSMTEAALTVHHCARHDPLYGIAVSWTVHNLLLLDWDRYDTHTGTQQAMSIALGGVLRAFGYMVTPFGSGGTWLVTGRRGTEAGR